MYIDITLEWKVQLFAFRDMVIGQKRNEANKPRFIGTKSSAQEMFRFRGISKLEHEGMLTVKIVIFQP